MSHLDVRVSDDGRLEVEKLETGGASVIFGFAKSRVFWRDRGDACRYSGVGSGK